MDFWRIQVMENTILNSDNNAVFCSEEGIKFMQSSVMWKNFLSTRLIKLFYFL